VDPAGEDSRPAICSMTSRFEVRWIQVEAADLFAAGNEARWARIGMVLRALRPKRWARGHNDFSKRSATIDGDFH